MRIAFVLTVLVGCLVPRDISAQSSSESSLRLMHSVLVGNEQQTLTVVARDLSGSPMRGASITARIGYGSTLVTYHLPRAGDGGQSSITFRPPIRIQSHTASVAVEISNGYLQVALSGTFRIGSVSPAPTVVALTIAARILPAQVVAPAPAYVVVASHTSKGIVTPRIHVWATARFKEGLTRLSGIADSAGVATLRLDTSKVSSTETVKITAGATWGTAKGTSESILTVRTQRASTSTAVSGTAIPTVEPGPTVTQTPTPTATPTALPTVTPTAFVVPTAAAPVAPTWTPTPTATPTAAPTWTPVPTWTPTPTPTATVLPSSTAAATVTPTAQVVLGTNTPATTSQCPGSQQGCVQAMLNIINTTRAQQHLQPYSLDGTESNCAYAHSVHMHQAGFISHDQFPKPDLCIGYSAGGENVGTFKSGNELQDLQSMHNQMMSEGYSPGCTGSHACNILSSTYTVVGIGVYSAPDGSTWLTEDFVRP